VPKQAFHEMAELVGCFPEAVYGKDGAFFLSIDMQVLSIEDPGRFTRTLELCDSIEYLDHLSRGLTLPEDIANCCLAQLKTTGLNWTKFRANEETIAFHAIMYITLVLAREHGFQRCQEAVMLVDRNQIGHAIDEYPGTHSACSAS
jgi:hypothetical protein